MKNNANTAKSLYDAWSMDREPFLRRARECSTYTIPFLIPPQGHTGASDFSTPWQSFGAQGVNSLTAKLLMATLPPNAPMFRYEIDDATLAKFQKEEERSKVEYALGKRERSIGTEIETTAVRVGAYEALRHLLVGGNALVYLPDNGGIKVFRLDRYVVKRDAAGNVLHIIVKENISPKLLPPEVKQVSNVKDEDYENNAGNLSDTKDVEIYTCIERTSKNWKVYQEVNGVVIASTRGTYPLGKSPWIPIRFTRIDGEDYGRGYVEEYLGDLKSLEGLSQAIVEGSAAAAKVLFLVNPNGTTKAKKLATAPNGAIVEGSEADISTMQLNKFNDFRVASETISNIQERLSLAFMLNSSVQRNAERVTAEEIRFMAAELESTLGGVYSILSQEFQLPLVSNIEFRMERQKKLPTLPKGIVKPVIVTGLEALGRGNDLNKLTTLFKLIAETFGPNAITQEMNTGDAITRLTSALGIDAEGLIKSDAQKQQEQQQAQMMAAAQQMVAPATQAAGRVIEKGMTNGQG